MDSAASSKGKLAQFRIKELKDVLTQLGLSKQGKKQDLVDKILGLLSDDEASKMHGWGKKYSMGREGVAKIIEDTYRKMQVSGAPELASKSSDSNINDMKSKEETNDSYQPDVKVRCPCGSSLTTQSMIKCEDLRCQVWQHIACVIVSEKTTEGVQPEIPSVFYCEICRINRADPFWVTLAHPLLPMRLTPSNTLADGTNDVQSTDRSFQLKKVDKDLLQKTEFDLQIWCILLNDKVPFRMQWPQHADLHVNGLPIRTTNRPGSQLLGINGRDDGPLITTCSREGVNRISLSRSDARQFCIGIRIAKRRTVQQILSLVPKESMGECFEDALSRVCRCVGGGTVGDNADSDSDLEVVADSITVNLRCPMSGSRMKIAGRFKPCVHMGCFDLETFVELNQRSRKWQCPICLKNYSLENIIIDSYFNRITSMLRGCGEDVNEIDVKPDGSWRAKIEGDFGDLVQWHLPDGSLSVAATAVVKSEPQVFNQVKQESLSDGHVSLKLGIKKNSNGLWEVSKPEVLRSASSRTNMEDFENHSQKFMLRSSSVTASYREGEDPSVSQDGGGHIDLSMSNGPDFDPTSQNFDRFYNVASNFDDGMPSGTKGADIIVLSDSEEENEMLFSNEIFNDNTVAENRAIPVSVAHPVDPEPYSENPGIGRPSENSCVNIYGNGDDFGMPLWTLPSSQTGPGFQLFNPDVDVPDVLVDEQQNSFGCSPFDGFGLTEGDGNGVELPNLPDTQANGALIDNPLAFGSDDPSLQIFLPTRPTPSSHTNLTHNVGMTNGCGQADDWISLRLGGAGPSNCDTAPHNLNSMQPFSAENGRMDSLADTASLLLSMNDDRSKKGVMNSQRSDNSLHPVQPRAVRPRLYLSIDSDSE